jgi:excisionase family DNA binding protein
MDDLSHTNSIANWIAVTDASRLLNVSVDTIRRWEKKGLIKGKRDLNGHRLFQKSELILHHIKLLNCLRVQVVLHWAWKMLV